MRRVSAAGTVGFFVFVCLLALLPGAALAHERRAVGKYDFVVGFLNEPAFEGLLNGIDLTVTNSETKAPVEGVEKTVEAQVQFGGQPPLPIKLRARFGQPGKYAGDFVPSKPGTYSFTFKGSIEGQAINEQFESGPGRFNDVQQIAPLQYPAVAGNSAGGPAGTNVSSTTGSPDSSAALSAAQKTASDAQAVAKSAQDDAAGARTLGYVGIGLGVLGVLVAIGALALGRRGGGSPAGLS